MKKSIALALTSVLVLGALSGCGSSSSSSASSSEATEKYGSDTLKVFNWGEYIGEDVISDFEKEFGVKVIYEMFDSNEMMYTKLQAGDSYDVLVPSDYMIERLIKEDMLQPIDKSLIPNMESLTDGVMNADFDPDNTYSVPYFWGSVGIVYNKENVDYADLEKEGWGIFKDTKYAGQIYMYDSERDSFMIALKDLGYSMNTDNDAEIDAAYAWLQEVNKTMDPVYVTDEVIDNMANGSKDLAVLYSGDAAYVLSENEDMGFYCPDAGTNIWIDSMVIPANAENPALAHEFINYILTYDASYANSEEIGYTSSNDEVMADLSGEDGDYFENDAYIPRAGFAKDEVYLDVEHLRQRLSELWIKVKAGE